VADSVVTPGLSLSTTGATIEFEQRDRTDSEVKVDMDITPGAPGPDDIIGLYVDGVEVFNAPFSYFVLGRQ